jgi:hypothetical protein
LEQPFEDRLEAAPVKMAALALKDATDLVEQKQKWTRLLTVCLYALTMRLLFRVAGQSVVVRI